MRALARKYEPSEATIWNWKRRTKAKASEFELGESEAVQLRFLRGRIDQLEQENALLKKSDGLPWSNK